MVFASAEPAKVIIAISTFHVVAPAILLYRGAAFRAMVNVISKNGLVERTVNDFAARLPRVSRMPAFVADPLAAFTNEQLL